MRTEKSEEMELAVLDSALVSICGSAEGSHLPRSSLLPLPTLLPLLCDRGQLRKRRGSPITPRNKGSREPGQPLLSAAQQCALRCHQHHLAKFWSPTCQLHMERTQSKCGHWISVRAAGK